MMTMTTRTSDDDERRGNHTHERTPQRGKREREQTNNPVTAVRVGLSIEGAARGVGRYVSGARRVAVGWVWGCQGR